jgi:hypothetical protein
MASLLGEATVKERILSECVLLAAEYPDIGKWSPPLIWLYI